VPDCRDRDDDGIDVLESDEILPALEDARRIEVELTGERLADLWLEVGDGREARTGDGVREVPRVDGPHATDADDADVEECFARDGHCESFDRSEA
jgi:hypothetical protein